jgi:sugar lactone lactonase YvrE
MNTGSHKVPTQTQMIPAALFALVLALGLGAGCDDDPEPYDGPIVLEIVDGPGRETPAGQTVTATVRVSTPEGATLAGVEVGFSVALGGGAISEAALLSDDDGFAGVDWVIGVAPTANRLSASVGEESVALETTATLEQPWEAEPLGDIETYLADLDVEESTEDLVFDSEDRLLMGAGSRILVVEPDGAISELSLSGDSIQRALGMTLDPATGNIWLADSDGAALRMVTPEGAVSTPLGGEGSDALQMPNDVAVGPDGYVYLSDSCGGAVYRVDPVTGAIEAETTFDVTTEGGPNGLAFDATGDLWVTTENVVLFCGIEGDAFGANAGLFRVPVEAGSFGEREALFTNVAQFGDGLVFDAEGNLYVIFDHVYPEMASMIKVLPAGGTELLDFITVTDRLLANVVFGRGEYGTQRLFISLLAIAPFFELRGLNTFELGTTDLVE